MKKILLSLATLAISAPAMLGANYMKEMTIAADGSGDFTTFADALEAIRAYMDYRVTVHVKTGV